MWNEVHCLSPTTPGDSSFGFPDSTSMYRSCSLTVSLYSRPEWKLPKSVNPSHPQRLQIGDVLLASATVGLSPLTSGFPFIEGWYHLLDENQRCIGQIKLSVFQHGSDIVPSDFYDYVDSALELSGAMAEPAMPSAEEGGYSRECDELESEEDSASESMSIRLLQLMKELEADRKSVV